MKILIRAAQNKQRGHMWPAGRQFDMPGLDAQLDCCFCFIDTTGSFLKEILGFCYLILKLVLHYD